VKRIAVIGGGPIGLECALAARRRGLEVSVYEAGRVGEHFRRYGAVRLFTPFRMNSTPLGRERLAEAGVPVPGDDDIVTAEGLCERYLEPLSRLSELRGAVREGERVLGVAREGFRKPHAGSAAGPRGRAAHPFLLRVRTAAGEIRFDRAEAVVDASGVYGTPNATGPGGLPASGEETIGGRLDRHLPSVTGRDRTAYGDARVLLIGDGRSAATVIRDLAEIVAAGGPGARTRVEWIHRDRGGNLFSPVPAETLRALPELRALHERATEVARTATWITRHPGATPLSYRATSGGVQARIAEADGSERIIEVDRVLALVGFHPDLELYRELQVHLCYASEGPMALAAAILAAEAADPAAAGDCLGQTAHGPASLKSPEPDFYILGAKSYGRNPNFLLSLGYQQIADILDLLTVPALTAGRSA
jgi:thioredoxin reductase